MSALSRLTMLGTVAGLSFSVLAPSTMRAEAKDVFFDPILDGAFCTPGREARNLLGHYRKLAKAETRPFSPPGGAQSSAQDADAPLFNNLGTLSHRIATANAPAQKYFDQGLRLGYAFNHAEARRAFQAAQKHDPDCAMCYWGEALVLGPNINAPMDAAAVAPAVMAVRAAQERAGRAGERDRALIEALAKRYPDAPDADRAAADAAYADAMAAVAARFADENVQVLYAEALMDLSPWDYWDASGKPKGKTESIVAALEKVLAKNPDHPGAIHYYIHMMEASAAPEKAIPYARRLAAAMPGAGHLVHMPFHIYFRTGDYKAALAANKAAVAVDEAYIARAAPTGVYPAAYYPHNVHSLMVSAQMAGDGKTAIAAAEKLARVVTSEASRAIPWVQPIQAAPYFAHAQFSRPATILALADPGKDLPLVRAMWHYARGVAYAAEKNLGGGAGRGAIHRPAQGRRFYRPRRRRYSRPGDPRPCSAHRARTHRSRRGQVGGSARCIRAGRVDPGSASLRRAAALVLPGATIVGGGAAAARQVRSGRRGVPHQPGKSPNNGWALFGLRELYGRSGHRSKAVALGKRLERAWAGDRGRLDLARL